MQNGLSSRLYGITGLTSLTSARFTTYALFVEVCPAFIDETGVLSGTVKEQPIYGIGVLVVSETQEITDSFYRLHFNFIQERAKGRNEIRRRIQSQDTSLTTLEEIDRLMWSTSHHEYKFVDVSRFNIQQYIDILNLYSLFPSLEFHSLIMDRRDSNASLGDWNNDAWEAYTNFARELLAERLTRDVFAIVDLQGKPNRSSIYLEEVLCSVSSVKGCLRATSDMSIYLQLVDLLLGCVQFDFKSQMGYFEPTSRRAQEKLQLVNFLKSKLGMRQGEAFLRKGQSFKRWDTPSVFTVWKREW